MKRTLIISTLAATLSLSSGVAFSADQNELIYGSKLMTQQERIEHRDKMRAAQTTEQREQIRKEHHEKMKARAKAEGVILPDEPPTEGGGMRQGGMGQGGMGQGGMGQGGMGQGGMGQDSGMDQKEAQDR